MTKEDSTLRDQFSRRQFLALCAAGSLSALLAACQSGSTPSSAETPTPTPTKRPTATATTTPQLTDADWAQLNQNLHGNLVRPGSSRYTTAHQLFDPTFDTIMPTAIAYCGSPSDVQACIAFAQKFQLPLVPRSGGHSYAGYSTTSGMVLDVTRMNAVNVNTTNGTATIGAGTRLIDVYAALSAKGLALPAGSCPTVGIAGLTLGGGVGVLGRKFGLTCDNLLSAQIVLANRRVLTCNASSYPDLYWALQGGGGGNFGVVTSFTFQAHPVSSLSLGTLEWPWSNAADVFNAWQSWAPSAPDELWSNCLFLSSSDDMNAPPTVRVNGVYVGDVSVLNRLLQQLISKIPVSPTTNYSSNVSLFNVMMDEAGCYGKTVAECHLPSQNPQGQVQRVPQAAKSDYFTKAIPRKGIDALVNAINTRQYSSMLGTGGIGVDAYGGAINRVAPNATAFVHRDELFQVQYTANWNIGASSSIIAANRSWLQNVWQAMRPYASGFAYQNYIDPHLSNWQQVYYGSNLPRLQHIKATYDPANFFHFAQSIPPAS
jgi:FAD/FMN-containing dehydrogenase